MSNILLNVNSNTAVVLSLSIILFFGFFITRITKKLKLPNVTGYIISGILIGPYGLNLIPSFIISNMEFVTDVALAFIAFDVGRFLKLSIIKENSSQVFIITLCESLVAAFLVTIIMIFVFKLPISFSILLGAISAATAPASTIMTIRQYKAKGSFVNMILQVVALDDIVALVAFSICSSVAQALSSNEKLNLELFIEPILLNLAAIGLGIVLGFILNRLINSKRTDDNRLILAITMILTMTGFCAAFDISPLLSCMALGTTYINISKSSKLFKQLNNFTPPILTIFFVLAGMRLDVPSLATGGIIGVTYFIVRIIGKYIGAYIGASLSNAEPEIRKYLGLALIPQAGVSIGLAFLGQRILPSDMGVLLSTIILSSSILYEIVGPISAKTALHLAGSIHSDDIEDK
ncbi:cation:proton antiporter [Sporanaerobacter acetigenes]|uniref:Transporter, CPA2 family (TC 2.A.37) n=1 Tax=Sporanaerobacter acetigenes DSM 13106 TaxID=1123281 RepID=A0A1M5Z6D7_9FIRM|nr:cation:proton antiporter [Sporanaerobacter acetigenes]SHI19816.1 transporter, CPA2 family (TC 2.A.37) [Sporanaerobacter acetigenes DSM 13106]